MLILAQACLFRNVNKQLVIKSKAYFKIIDIHVLEYKILIIK